MIFGKKEPEDKKIVGAVEKQRLAKAALQGADPFSVDAKDDKKHDLTAPIVAIYGISVALAVLLTQGAIKDGVSFHLPHPLLQKWLLGHPPPVVMGDTDMDLIIAGFVRGTVIFLLAGLVPLATKIMCRLQKRRPEVVDTWLGSVVVTAVALAIFYLDIW